MDTKTEITREHRRDKIELAALWGVVSIYNASAAINESTWSFTSNDWNFHASGTGIIAYVALVLSIFYSIKFFIEVVKRHLTTEAE